MQIVPLNHQKRQVDEHLSLFLSLIFRIRIKWHFLLMSLILIVVNSDIFQSGENRCIISKELSVWWEIFWDIIYVIRKKKGPNTEPWGVPASTGYHDDVWSFNTTLWNLFFKKRIINLRCIPFIPMYFILWIRPSCQTQWKTPQTSTGGLQSQKVENLSGVNTEYCFLQGIQVANCKGFISEQRLSFQMFYFLKNNHKIKQ